MNGFDTNVFFLVNGLILMLDCLNAFWVRPHFNQIHPTQSMGTFWAHTFKPNKGLIEFLLCLPERTTISWVVKPLFEKAEMRSLRSIRGDGISLVAPSLLAVVESLLPNPTLHDGPPNCEI